MSVLHKMNASKNGPAKKSCTRRVEKRLRNATVYLKQANGTYQLKYNPQIIEPVMSNNFLPNIIM